MRGLGAWRRSWRERSWWRSVAGCTRSSGRGGLAAGARWAGTSTRRGNAAAPAAPSGATTIDALFAPLPRTETFGRAWVFVDNQLRPLRLRLGISDGQNTEIIEGDVKEGTEVVTNVVDRRAVHASRDDGVPGLRSAGRGGFPGGGFHGGGGGNRGGAGR